MVFIYQYYLLLYIIINTIHLYLVLDVIMVKSTNIENLEILKPHFNLGLKVVKAAPRICHVEGNEIISEMKENISQNNNNNNNNDNRNKRMSGDHPNYSFKINQNTEKSPGNLMSLNLHWETISQCWCEKLSIELNNDKVL